MAPGQLRPTAFLATLKKNDLSSRIVRRREAQPPRPDRLPRQPNRRFGTVTGVENQRQLLTVSRRYRDGGGGHDMQAPSITTVKLHRCGLRQPQIPDGEQLSPSLSLSMQNGHAANRGDTANNE